MLRLTATGKRQKIFYAVIQEKNKYLNKLKEKYFNLKWKKSRCVIIYVHAIRFSFEGLGKKNFVWEDYNFERLE